MNKLWFISLSLEVVAMSIIEARNTQVYLESSTEYNAQTNQGIQGIQGRSTDQTLSYLII